MIRGWSYKMIGHTTHSFSSERYLWLRNETYEGRGERGKSNCRLTSHRERSHRTLEP